MKLKLIILLIFLYLYIYNPIFNFVGIGSAKLILVFSLLFSFFNKKTLQFLTYFKIEFFFIMLLCFYSVLLYIKSGNNAFSQGYLFLVWFAESIFTPIILIILFYDQFKKYHWDKIIFAVGLIASVISLFLIYNPEINDYVKNTLLQTSSVVNDNYQLLRGYGLASGLMGSYAMVQGMILGICFYLGRQKWWYLLFLIPIIISIAFNARTGLIAIPVSLLILLFSFQFNIRFIIYFIVILFLIYNIDFSSIEIIANYKETFDWLFKGFLEMTEILQGDNSSNLGRTLFIDEKFLPSSILEFVFGTGNFSGGFYRVDNGYYYLLWFGGWLMMLIVFLFILYMFYRLFKIQKNNYYTYLFFILLLIYTVKSNYLFNPSGISRLIGLYYVYSIINNKIKFKYFS